MTRDFLDALNLFDLREALAWTVGVQNAVTDVTKLPILSAAATARASSRAASAPTARSGISSKLGFNTDFLQRGADRLHPRPQCLAGRHNSQGGSAVIFTKKARTDRTFASISPAAGSWDKHRAAVDVNYAFNDKLALRVNWVSQKADTWRDLEFKRSSGQHLTGTYRPVQTHHRARRNRGVQGRTR